MFFLFPFLALAEKAEQNLGEHLQAQKPTAARQANFNGPVFQLGFDSRFERDESQTIVQRSFMSYAAGYIYSNWIFEGEYGSFGTSSGNATLSVDRKTESLLLWTYWQALDFRHFAPYVGGAMGGIRDTVQTQFLGSSEADESPWNLTIAGAFGVRFLQRTHFWLSIETRLYKNTHLDPDPQFGALLRLGAVFF